MEIRGITKEIRFIDEQVRKNKITPRIIHGLAIRRRAVFLHFFACSELAEE